MDNRDKAFIGVAMIAIGITCNALGQSSSYTIGTVAGPGDNGDGGPAIAAQFVSPRGVAFDGAGNMYIADFTRVRKVSVDGTVSPFAGTWQAGFSGDGGPATEAILNGPVALAIDRSGAVYIADAGNNRVRKVTTDGIIQTVAGPGVSGVIGDGGPATSGRVNTPSGVAVDNSGNLFISEPGTQRIRIVSNGIIQTVVNSSGLNSDGSRNIALQLGAPLGLAIDDNGSLYIADAMLNLVLKVTPANAGGAAAAYKSGVISTIKAENSLESPSGLAVDAAGNLYIADTGNNRIMEVTASGRTVAVTGNIQAGSSGDGGPATAARLDIPQGVAVDAAGNVYVADTNNRRIRKIAVNGTISAAAGRSQIDPSNLFGPTGVALDDASNTYIADTNSNRVLRIAADGAIGTLAGTGASGFAGDGGPATAAKLNGPRAVATDKSGNVYIADTGNGRIRKVTPGGVIQTVAGPGTAGMPGDGGPATSARVNSPRGVAVDNSGNLFFADNIDRIRIVTNGISQTIVNRPNPGPGFSGDGGQASAARLNRPAGLALDAKGNLYIADQGNNRIRKVTPSNNSDVALAYETGIITSIAGTGTDGFSGDGGQAVAAALSTPMGVAVDASGAVYIADFGNNRIRMIDPNGVIATIAGNGVAGFSGDSGSALKAQLDGPFSVSVNAAGDVFFVDVNARLRELTPPRQIAVPGVLNVASLLPGPVAPGEIVVIDGTDIGPAQAAGFHANDSGVLDTLVAGTRVLFDGIPAPLISVQAKQVSVIVPYAVAGRASTSLQIEYQGRKTNPISLPLASAAPGIFTRDSSGTGPGMVLNEDSTPNSPGNPAAVGSLVTFSATGEGQTDPPGVDGKVAADALPAPTQSVSVRIGGKEAPVIHVGAVAGLPAGFFQVTARVPDVEPTPYQIPVVLTVGGVSTQPGVTMSVQLQGGAPATSMTLDSPRGLAFDDWGNLYIADRSANRVLKMAPSGAIDTFAGAGTAGFGNDGGPAAAALLNTPRAVAVDKSGAVYIADTGNSRIRRVSPDGVIQTVAGQGVAGVTGDGGPAISGRVNLPSGVAVDRSGNLYLSEFSSGRVRIISNGIINTFAGSDTRIGFSGDGGPAIAAGLVNPYGVAVDTRGNVYIADQGDHRVRKVNQAGVISTIDGNGARGSGPNLLSLPTDVAADATGNVYIADASNNRIVKVTVSGEFIILAGDGRAGDSGDGGPATAARLSNPQGVAVDGAGNVYVSDTNNNRVRKITPQGVITTVAGVQ